MSIIKRSDISFNFNNLLERMHRVVEQKIEILELEVKAEQLKWEKELRELHDPRQAPQEIKSQREK